MWRQTRTAHAPSIGVPFVLSMHTRRSSLQQMYYLASRTSPIRLPEEYLVMSRMGKRPSFGSNTSVGSAHSLVSNCSTGYSTGRHYSSPNCRLFIGRNQSL